MRPQLARGLNAIFSFLILGSMLIGIARISVDASAHANDLQDSLRIDYSDETGRVSFIGADPGRSYQMQGVAIETIAPLNRPMMYLEHFGPLLGLGNPRQELQQLYNRSHDGRSTTRYQQVYQNVPIMAGELIVNLDRRGGLLSISGEISPDLSLSTTPEVTASEARETAIAAVAKGYGLEASDLTATEPELWIYDQRLLRPSTRPAELVWRMDVVAVDGLKPIRELVLINAVRGGVSLHFNQIGNSWGTFEEEPPEPPDPTPTPTIEPTVGPTATLEPTATESPPTPTPTLEPTPTETVPTPTAQPRLPDDGGEGRQEPFQSWGDGDEYYVKPGGNNSADCQSPATACATINGAIGKAASGDTIYIAIGTYTGSDSFVVDIDRVLLLSGGWELDFSAQTDFSVIDGENARSGLYLGPGIISELEFIKIANGHSISNGSRGGGIYTEGNLTLQNCIVTDNDANFDGGGIFTAGSTTIRDSEISNNHSSNTGGAMLVVGGSVEISNSTISGNSALNVGGIFTAGVLILNNVTMANNTATGEAGGLVSGVASSVTMSNTVLADNFAPTGPDCMSPWPITSLGYNLIEDPTDCSFTPATGDIIGVDPGLIALQGAPSYHFFGSSSALVDAGNPAAPGGGGSTCLSLDQRGAARPFDGDDNGEAICDIGAVEYAEGNTDIVQIYSGSPQGAEPLTAFTDLLQVRVVDEYGIAMPGEEVTFTAPASGPSGTFTDTTTNVTNAVTNVNGIAIAAVFNANGEEGQYFVEASIPGEMDTADFDLTNAVFFADSVAVYSGSPQVGFTNAPFSLPLEAVVYNQFDAPMSGVTVTFTAPASGASGIFEDTLTIETVATSDSGGVAIAAELTANDQEGSYSVLATVAGVIDPAVFALTNEIRVVWYVSPDGDDGFDCDQVATACATIEGVLAKPAYEGEDLILVETGTYTKSGANVIEIDSDATIQGGWNADFTSQTGYSHVDCQGQYYAGIHIAAVHVNLDHFQVEECESYGIYNNGWSVLSDMLLVNNHGSSGGGIRNNEYLHLINSVVRWNVSSQGGGINNPSGSHAIVENSIIQDNEGYGIGGGIFNSGTLDIINSTLSKNTADDGGGLYAYSNSSATINNTTITNNFAPDGEGGGIAGTGDVIVLNSIVAGNFAGAYPDCSGYSIDFEGFNVLGIPDGSCSYTEDDFISVDPLTFAIEVNGGPDVIYALMPGSPAIDAANPAVPGSGGNACAETDQRGVTRPLDGDEDGTAICDIGAYELDPADPPPVPDPGPEGARRTFTSQNTNWIPGSFLCDQTQASCTAGAIPHADVVHAFAGDAYAFFITHHDRDSFDDEGGIIISSVHVGEGYNNAAWTGSQMIFGDVTGYVYADDVVAHEFTHGVTQHTSNLFYYYQSGAINESFSDLWGEFIDMTNGVGDDRSAVRWRLGENIPGSVGIRDMKNPPVFDDPDRMKSPNYYTGYSDYYNNYGDSGGVHTNSGVNNKAVYLMTDGGSFNGQTITGLGMNKVIAIYYEVQTNLLTSGSDYRDLYNALYQGCLNLVGGAEGITAANCTEVQEATLAVEMDQEPLAGYNPEAAICEVEGEVPYNRFYDDFESGTAFWERGIVSGTLDNWYGTTWYAISGAHSLWGNDYVPEDEPPIDTYVTMIVDVEIPAGIQPFLHFNHAFGFEDPHRDGGWLEYSTDGGGSWADAGSMFDDGLDYIGTLATGRDNPNGGHVAFIGDSHGYVSTRYDLSSLAGQDVRFRWRMSTDSDYYDWGWWIDDVRIYSCAVPSDPPYTPGNPYPADTAIDVSVHTDLVWDGGDPDGDPVTYDVYLDAGNPAPETLICNNVSTPSCDPGELTADETYYWYVVASDGNTTTAGPVWSFTTESLASVELLRNSDLEIIVPSGWKGSNLEIADGSDCSTAHGGSCAAALTGASGGETKMLFYGLPGFSGSAGDTFHLSYWNRRQDVGGAGAVQVRVTIRYTDATMGHFSYVPGVGTADWALFEEDFTAAKDYDWGVVRLIFSKPDGTLWYDDISLERNGSEELLNNNDMELRVPSMWKGDKLTLADGADCTESHSGTCSAALTGSVGGETKMLFYGLPGFSGSAGDTFALSYYNKRQDVGGAGAVQVRVSIRYTDATMGHFSFVPGVGTADWTYFVHEFTAAKDYDWGVIRLIFSKPDGTLWYDEISLVR